MTDKAMIVDQSALRFNQASIIIFLALASLLNQPLLVVFVAAVMWIRRFSNARAQDCSNSPINGFSSPSA